MLPDFTEIRNIVDKVGQVYEKVESIIKSVANITTKLEELIKIWEEIFNFISKSEGVQSNASHLITRDSDVCQYWVATIRCNEGMKETNEDSNVVIIAKATRDLCEKSDDEIACHLAELHKRRACEMCDCEMNEYDVYKELRASFSQLNI